MCWLTRWLIGSRGPLKKFLLQRLAKELRNRVRATDQVILQPFQKGIFILLAFHNKLLDKKYNLPFLYRDFWDNFSSVFMPYENYINQKIPSEVGKNLSRLTSDIAENISKVIDKNRKLVGQYIYNEILSIENIIDNQKFEPNNYKQAIEEIEKISKVKDITKQANF